MDTPEPSSARDWGDLNCRVKTSSPLGRGNYIRPGVDLITSNFGVPFRQQVGVIVQNGLSSHPEVGPKGKGSVDCDT